ncbi:kinase-like domain-containing protein [Hyaloraphidium curvatum]|nr:kinase-like domain-containing protein [Hyaloraphidium curvatum]
MPDPDSPLTAVAGSKFVVRAEDVIVDKSKILGKGNFGVVYEGVLRGSVKVAVKVARREFDVDAARAFAKEIKNWEGLAQRNVLPLIAFTIDPPMLISEIADGGNLREYLKSRSWPRDQGLRLLCDVARGMSYLHSFGILHGDLKCANVLVDAAAGRALVSDFGLSKFRQPGDGSVSIGGPDAHVPGGTVGFMAPEIMMGEPLRPPADVFSFAMLCYEVVSNGLYPFGGAPNYWAVSYAVTSKGARPDRPADVLDSVWAVMERSWAQEPADRPTFPKVGEELEAIAAATK